MTSGILPSYPKITFCALKKCTINKINFIAIHIQKRPNSKQVKKTGKSDNNVETVKKQRG